MPSWSCNAGFYILDAGHRMSIIFYYCYYYSFDCAFIMSLDSGPSGALSSIPPSYDSYS